MQSANWFFIGLQFALFNFNLELFYRMENRPNSRALGL